MFLLQKSKIEKSCASRFRPLQNIFSVARSGLKVRILLSADGQIGRLFGPFIVLKVQGQLTKSSYFATL